MELDFEGLEMQNEIYQWIELKEQIQNGVICLVIMLSPRTMVIKMLKMAHFFIFLLMTDPRKYTSSGKQTGPGHFSKVSR